MVIPHHRAHDRTPQEGRGDGPQVYPHADDNQDRRHQAAASYNLRLERWRRALMMSRTLTALETPAEAGLQKELRKYPNRQTDRLVSLGLLAFVNRNIFEKDGLLEAWPSVPLLADCTGLSVGTIKNAVKRLKARGIVAVTPEPQRRHNRYRFQAAWLVNTEAELGKMLNRWPDHRLDAPPRAPTAPAAEYLPPRQRTGPSPAPRRPANSIAAELEASLDFIWRNDLDDE